MSGPKPIPLKLSDTEQQALQQLVRRRQVRQQIAWRARIVLAADAHHAGYGASVAQTVGRLAADCVG